MVIHSDHRLFYLFVPAPLFAAVPHRLDRWEREFDS
jgi:hypothetical protein